MDNIGLGDHKQLNDVVMENLRQMIRDGQLPANDWLRQDWLQRELEKRGLKVSYTPIREALKQLGAEGLVEHVPYRGVRVIQFSLDDAIDIYEMRASLEGIAAKAAATHMTEEERATLRQLHQQMLDASQTPADLNRINDLNRQFHLLIIRGSRRTHLVRTLEQLWLWFPTMLWNRFALAADAATPERAGADNHEHADILAAIEVCDPQAAEARMRYHIEQTQRALLHHLETAPKRGG